VAAPADPGKQRLDAYVVQQLTARLRSASDWLVRTRWTAAPVSFLPYCCTRCEAADSLFQVRLVLWRATYLVLLDMHEHTTSAY